MKNGTVILGAMGLGAGLMYFLDPDRGRRRRAMVGDKVDHAINAAENAIGKTSRDLRNRTIGAVAEFNSLLQTDEADDEVVKARIRAKLGRMVSHPHAIYVEVVNGKAILTGQALAFEVDQLLKKVWSVRGVRGVLNQLEVHQDAGNIPALQGGTIRAGQRIDLLQTNWSPATRFIAGLSGGALALHGIRRKDIFSAAVGLGLIARGATNLKMKDILGLRGSRGLTIQKAIHIDAPVSKVYDLWSHHENFPHFMSRVREVKDLGEGRYHWTVSGPAGIPVEWEAVIRDQEPDRYIAWESVPGSMVEQHGTVRFQALDENHTLVDVKLSYNPPAGAVGHLIATIFGADPKSEMDADLLRMKSYIESGHQPHDAVEKQTARAFAH